MLLPNMIKTKKRYILSAFLYIVLLGTFFFYTKSLNKKIAALQQSNNALEKKGKKSIEALHKIQKKLEIEENKVNTLEDILENKIAQTLSQNKHKLKPFKKHFFIKKEPIHKEPIYIEDLDTVKKAEARVLRDELERQLAQIFAQNENLQQHYSHPDNIQNLISALAKSELNKRYVWGAEGPETFDCSGLTQSVYEKLGIKIPRVSRDQAEHGIYIKRENLKIGDLIFFDTSKEEKGTINHVGIYLGNDKFIHASSASESVIITSLNKPFYAKRYKWARRVVNDS